MVAETHHGCDIGGTTLCLDMAKVIRMTNGHYHIMAKEWAVVNRWTNGYNHI